MYLGHNVADNAEKLMPLFYVVLLMLGFLEASRYDQFYNTAIVFAALKSHVYLTSSCYRRCCTTRFSALMKIKGSLLRHDANKLLMPRSNRGTNEP